MNLAEIETFLTMVNTKSITRTADLLFLSQPTVSHRLNSLENELGFPLVIRNKGHKQVELTPKGMDFVVLAERWMSLWKETLTLQHNQERMLLTIGCTDSLNIAVFAPLYDEILQSHSHLDTESQRPYHGSMQTNGQSGCVLVGDHKATNGELNSKLI